MSAAWINSHRTAPGRAWAWAMRALVAGLMVLLAACGTDTDEALESLAGTPPAADAAGRVTDYASGSPLAGAVVSIGDQTTTTDAEGDFELPGVPVSTSAVVHVAKSGYMDAYVITSTVPGLTASVVVRMLAVAETTSVSVASGGTAVVTGSTAEAAVPANALNLADGTPAAGNVGVALTPIDMAQGMAVAPGDYTTSTGAPMEGFGGLSVTATDAGGAAVNLAAGQFVDVRIPATSRSATLPASASLFRFDGDTGRWVESGSATLTGTAPDQYYQGQVDALGAWAVGAVITPVVYVSGCVVKEGSGAAARGVRVETEGITYSGRSAGVTDAAGKFRIPVKANSQLIVSGVFGNFLTNTRSTSTGTTDVTLSGCLSLAALSGAPRITLSWGLNPADLDSHVFAPDGSHVYFSDPGDLTLAPFVALDVDDTTSYGPEVMTFRRLMVGTYTYAVHKYSGSGTQTTSPALVELRRGMDVKLYSPTVGMGELAGSTWWTVFTFTVDADCNITVNDVGVFSTGGVSGPDAPARPAPVTASYCTPAAL